MGVRRELLGIKAGCLVVLTILAMVFAGLTEPAGAETTVAQEWLARFWGLLPMLDEALALALDKQGNIYVTGYSYFAPLSDYDCDYLTIMYYPDGTLHWARRYNGPASSDDVAKAIVVDSQGNTYVTGGSSGGGGRGMDVTTIKYNPLGEELWVRRYDGIGKWNPNDGGQAMVLDGQDNIYVTGFSESDEAQHDYVTIKYSNDGQELWVRRYDGGGWDWATAIGVDGRGNVYVTGRSFGPGSNEDIATVKYSTDGEELWVRRYNGPGNDWDGANALVVDNQGNVYVSGWATRLENGQDYVTIKYSPEGDELWIRYYNGPGNGDDVVHTITLDDQSNVLVAGNSWGVGSDYDYATVKYSPSGEELWVRRYDGPAHGGDMATAIAIDPHGSVYVTGWSTGAGHDWATIKYSPSGQQEWLMRYDGPVSKADQALAIKVDGQGNVYVTGYDSGSLYPDDYDYATIKYRQGQAPIAPTISGHVRTSLGAGIGGVSLAFTGGGTAASDSDGFYDMPVSYGWSGTATPSNNGYSFSPSSRSYSDVTSNLFDQDYLGTPTAPKAFFIGNPVTGQVPLTVTFTDQSLGNITEWLWDFGDGTTSREQNPSHTYVNEGSYSVTLTISAGEGLKDTYSVTIRVISLNAAFTSDKREGTSPLTVHFVDLSTGSIDEWLWDFGDGSVSVEQNPTHIYTNPGRCSVSLTVSSFGLSDTEARGDYINVKYNLTFDIFGLQVGDEGTYQGSQRGTGFYTHTVAVVSVDNATFWPSTTYVVEGRDNGNLVARYWYEATSNELRYWGLYDPQTGYSLQFSKPLIHRWYPMGVGDQRKSSTKFANYPDYQASETVQVVAKEPVTLGFATLSAYKLQSTVRVWGPGLNETAKAFVWWVPYLADVKSDDGEYLQLLTSFAFGGGFITQATDHDGDGLLDYEEIAIYKTDWQDQDTDHDGIADGWEVNNNLDPLKNDALADADGDGFSNLREYRLGTDPRDPSSHPPKGLPWLPLLLGD